MADSKNGASEKKGSEKGEKKNSQKSSTSSKDTEKTVDKPSQAQSVTDKLLDEGLEYPFPSKSSAPAATKVSTSPSRSATTSANDLEQEDGRFWNTSMSGIQFGFSPSPQAPPQPQHYMTSPQGPSPPPHHFHGYGPYYGFPPFQAPMIDPRFGGWQQPPMPFYPQRERDMDSVSISSGASTLGKEQEDEQVQPAEEDNQDAMEQDPTEDLQYEFQESPLTVVHNKVAAIMQQALAETSTKNYAALLAKCGEFTFPANVKAQIPVLDFKVKSSVSPYVRHNDDMLICLQKMVMAIMAPMARVCEASVSLQNLDQKQLLERLAVVRKASVAALSALSASTGEIVRRRRLSVKEGAKGVIDMTNVEFSGSAAHQPSLFGDDLLRQMTFIKKGKNIFKNVYSSMGLTQGVIDTLSAARKSQSNVQYESYIERYDSWARANGVTDPFNCEIHVPLNFLQFMMDEPFDPKDLQRRRSFSVMRVIVSALSTVLFYDGLSFGNAKLTSQFMKGLLRLRPIKHRYKTQWDMNMVLDCLKNKPWIQAAGIPLDKLGKKAMILFLLATANRNHCVTELRISDDRFRDYGNKLEFLFLDEEVKRMGLDPVVKLKAFIKNRQIDPVWYINAYIHRTEKLRGDEQRLFISAQKPHKAISTSTARRWVREVLRDCGIDINRFGAGSTRGASASAGSAKGASLKEIMTAGGWRKASTFQDWYKRPIERELKSLSEYTFE